MSRRQEVLAHLNQLQRPLSTGDVAELFGVTYATVHRWVRKGWLSSFKTVGGQLRFDANDVIELLTGKVSTETVEVEANDVELN